MLRCLLVDDDATFLAAARNLLERDGVDVVASASSAAEAVAAAGGLRPDVAVVDVWLGAERGPDVALALTERFGTPVILVSALAEADVAELVDASPALGFLGKTALSRKAILGLLQRRPR